MLSVNRTALITCNAYNGVGKDVMSFLLSGDFWEEFVVLETNLLICCICIGNFKQLPPTPGLVKWVASEKERDGGGPSAENPGDTTVHG